MISSLATLTTLLPLVLPQEAPEAAPSTELVIRGAHVACPTLDAPLENQRITIQHGAIVRIEPEDGSPIDASLGDIQSLDGKGLYVAPGFYDMHVHLPGVDSSLPAEFQETALQMMLNSGITTARVSRGHHSLLDTAARLTRGEIAGPRLHLAAPALRRDSFPDLETARTTFAVWKSQGFQAVKFLSGPPAKEHAPYAAAAAEAGLRWYGHLPMGPVGDWPLGALTSLEHASALQRLVARSPETVDADLTSLATAGVFVCPDLDWYYAFSNRVTVEELLKRPGLALLPEGTMTEWTEQRRLPDPRRKTYSATLDSFTSLVPKLRAAGVELLVSASDAAFCAPGPGFAVECEHLVRAGYTAKEVLRMATWNAARCQGESSVRGAIKVGYVADLVLLRSNPLESVAAFAQVDGVVQGGRLVSGSPVTSSK